jgi:hypothetical protein
MRFATIMVQTFTALSLSACGTSIAVQPSSSLKTESEISGRTRHLNALLRSDVRLEKSFTREDTGWLLMYWKSPTRGHGNLEIRGLSQLKGVAVAFDPGSSAVAIGPSGELFTAGHVSGYVDRVCGPQGARCTDKIPTVTTEVTYPCGPQGATCKIAMPRTDDILME